MNEVMFFDMLKMFPSGKRNVTKNGLFLYQAPTVLFFIRDSYMS